MIGAGIASVAARHGLAVALVDRGDFGGATSSSSSKLIHGGLRYLRLGDVRLVREAHEERRHLMNIVAPHLVHQIPFLLPLYERGPYRPYVVQTGIAIYSTLARAKLNGLVDPARARRMNPDLRLDGLRKCGLYVDCWTNDSRLTLANVRAAADSGATVANYAEVVALRLERGRVAGAEVSADSATFSVRARTVVNASGPWLDSVRRLEDPAAARSIRLSKGVHVLLEAGSSWTAALTIPHDKVRVSFAVPWQGMLLLGTTDALYEGDPAGVAAEEADIDQVLAEASVALDPSLVQRDRIRSTYAGVRVLPGGEGGTTSARRETVYLRGSGGMLSVAGGKLTTYRRIALDVLEELRSDLGLHEIDRRPWPLPGAAGLDRIRLPVEVTPATRSPSQPALRLALVRGARAGARRSEPARAALARRPGHRRLGCLRGCQRVGPDRRGRGPAPDHARPSRLRNPRGDAQGRGADRGPEAAGARRCAADVSDHAVATGALPSTARAVVIGAGIVGCSVAYHLTRLGWNERGAPRQGPASRPGRVDRPRLQLHLPGRPLARGDPADARERPPVRGARRVHRERRHRGCPDRGAPRGAPAPARLGGLVGSRAGVARDTGRGEGARPLRRGVGDRRRLLHAVGRRRRLAPGGDDHA